MMCNVSIPSGAGIGFVSFKYKPWGTAESPTIQVSDGKTTKSLSNAGIGIGAQFVNVGHARIYGAEVSTAGKVDINKDMNLVYTIGYTYTEPEDMDYKKRKEVEDTYTDPLQMKNKSNDSKYLKYRNKHSFKATIDYNYKWFSIGTNLSYRSKILAVDYLMVDERAKEQEDLMDYARKFIFGCEDGVSLHDYWMQNNKDIFTAQYGVQFPSDGAGCSAYVCVPDESEILSAYEEYFYHILFVLRGECAGNAYECRSGRV